MSRNIKVRKLLAETFGEHPDAEINVKNLKLLLGTICDELNLGNRIVQVPSSNENYDGSTTDFDGDSYDESVLEVTFISSTTETNETDETDETDETNETNEIWEKCEKLEKELFKLRDDFEKIQLAFIDKMKEIVNKSIKIENEQKLLEERINKVTEYQKEEKFKAKKTSFWKSFKKKFKIKNFSKFSFYLSLYK